MFINYQDTVTNTQKSPAKAPRIVATNPLLGAIRKLISTVAAHRLRFSPVECSGYRHSSYMPVVKWLKTGAGTMLISGPMFKPKPRILILLFLVQLMYSQKKIEIQDDLRFFQRWIKIYHSANGLLSCFMFLLPVSCKCSSPALIGILETTRG